MNMKSWLLLLQNLLLYFLLGFLLLLFVLFCFSLFAGEVVFVVWRGGLEVEMSVLTNLTF